MELVGTCFPTFTVTMAVCARGRIAGRRRVSYRVAQIAGGAAAGRLFRYLRPGE